MNTYFHITTPETHHKQTSFLFELRLFLYIRLYAGLDTVIQVLSQFNLLTSQTVFCVS